MDRSQLLARVLLALGATACHSAPVAQPTTIRVDQPAEPDAEPKSGARSSDGHLPKRAHGYSPEWQPTEAGAGCTPTRKVPQGFSNPRYDGCPQRINRMSASVYDALKSPRPPQLGAEDDLRFDETLTARARAEGDLEACCYRRDYPIMYEGRPLRWRGELLLPELTCLVEGTAPASQIDWLASARHEHASSASFMRLALDLLALGAPRSLQDAAQIAARQELCHASLALRLAGKAGRRAQLGAMRIPVQLALEPRSARVVRVARELLLDAALGEGLAALEAAVRAREVPLEFREEMIELAEQELEHALFGWRTLRWLLGTQPRGALAPLLWSWLDGAEVDGDYTTRAMIREVMRPALASVVAGVAAQRQGVGHVSG
ncbi:MAG: hypothetical protein R3B07_23805 [Polyangiaceae bacterium]